MSYLNRLRTFACLIPKTGCTNWRRTFLAVWKRTNINDVSPFKNEKFDSSFYRIVPQFSNNKYYRDTDLDKIGIETRWWNRLITVRHPFSRLYSVWRDKFHNHPDQRDYSRQLTRFRKLSKIIAKFSVARSTETSDNSMVEFRPSTRLRSKTKLEHL